MIRTVRAILATVAIGLSFLAAPAHAQRISANYCSVSSPAVATGLLGFSCDIALTATILSQYSSALVCVYTQGIVWKDNGGNPTATPGTGGNGVTPSSSAPSCFYYDGSLAQIKFIQQTAGAVVGIQLYKTGQR